MDEDGRNPAEQAFSLAAEDYDLVSIGNPIVVRLRERAQRAMLRRWRAGERILELNCGTGEDAAFLARHGVQLLATDISPAMIARTEEKIRRAHLERFVETRVLSFEELQSLRGMQFDGALSMFGGLNCAADIRGMFRDIAVLLKPGAIFFASFLGKYSLWEFVSNAARLQLRAAFRRWRSAPVAANVYGIAVPVRYWSVAALKRFARSYFTIEHIESWSIVSPPPASLRFAGKWEKLSDALFACDNTVADAYPFNRLGDHIIFELKKK